MELSKKDKRLCREFIHKGLELECEQFVKELQKEAAKPIPLAELNAPYREENGWSVEGPWHKRYIQLYKLMYKFDRHIADRYDHATGGHYFDIIVGLYFDGLLTDDDIARLDETTQQEIAKIELINEMMRRRK